MPSILSAVNSAGWLTIFRLSLALCLIIGAAPLLAQNADIDWADAGVPSQGSFPEGTVTTGSDGTTATITTSSVSVGGGSFVPEFAPTFLSFFSGTLSTSPTPLFMSFNNSSFDDRDKITVTIELSRPVTELEFQLGDIDAGGFTDAIEVFHDSDLTGGFSNAATNTAFWTTGASVTRTNDAIVNGWRGTGGSGNGSTAGTLFLDFGSTAVQRIQLVYFSYSGTGDPVGQFLVISDFEYFAPSADLSLAKTVSDTNPTFGQAISYTLSLSNAGPQTATNVEVRDDLPVGFNITSATGFGAYDAATGIWSVGNVPAGQTRTITLNGTVSAPDGSTIINLAEVTASDLFDGDSTPGNGSTTEDDDASASFTVQGTRTAGIPPTLVCPAGTLVFDWDSPSVVWQAGLLNQTFSFGGLGDLNFAISSDGTFVNDATFGGLSPAESDANTGGDPSSGNSLHQFLDFSDRFQTATTVITLPNAVPGAQFTIFDVDFAANDFADLVTVTGTYQGATVIPELTNGTANFVVGNTAIGDITSGNTSGAANVEVTFDQPIDTITIVYGNANSAPDIPDGQAITIHDITFCAPSASISVTKISSILSDPVNDTEDPKAIPGALVEYLISVSNTGVSNVDADSLVLTDDHPADIKLCSLARAGGPVTFTDPGNDSGLSYSFSGLGIGSDDLEFSNDDGASFSYTPVDDGEGCDANITDWRLRPGGSLVAGQNIQLRVRYEIIDSGLPTP